ncbi:MAG: glycoside hydrolase family 5 protein [Chitinophagaceae bacterium]|nr:MAG: glycoside hydrolase family 5 protein [Chitinophagaceae bacterium]
MRLLFLWISLVATLSGSAQPVRKHGRLSVAGTQLVNERGHPVLLRGVSFGWHNWQPRYYTPGAVQWLASDWKATVVRAAMGIDPDGAYLQDSARAVALVEAVIEGALRAGIYVIVDWHSHNIRTEAANRFFRHIACKYGHHPHLIYEIFNEPDHEGWAEVKTYSEELIATIRALDPDNIILVGSPHWDQDLHLVAADPIRGATNIMYSMHFYAATHKAWLRERCDKALAAGIPLMLTEASGMEATGNGPTDKAEWLRYLQWAEKNRLSWLVWSVSDKNETCSMLQKGASPDGGWGPADLKESGRLTRALLRAFSRRNGARKAGAILSNTQNQSR